MQTKALKILFVMDPYATLNQATETSLLLMAELMQRGHIVIWAEIQDVFLENRTLRIRGSAVQSLEPFCLAEPRLMDGADFDAVLIRLDPPFGSNYLHLSYLFDFLPPGVLQVNPASALRALNEKLSALRFAEHVPTSVVSMDPTVLQEFSEKHQRVVLKPLDDCSGRGVAMLEASQPDLAEQIQALLVGQNGRPRYLQAQVFLPQITAGDKRVYLLDGEVLGIVNRVPAPGRWLGNIHQGASVEAATLSQREAQTVASLRPHLRAHGLVLVGLDFIGGHLTEINITSPSALRQINAVSASKLERRIVDWLEQRLCKQSQPNGNSMRVALSAEVEMC